MRGEAVLVVLLVVITVDVLLRGPLVSLDALLADYEREPADRYGVRRRASRRDFGQRGILLLPLLVLCIRRRGAGGRGARSSSRC